MPDAPADAARPRRRLLTVDAVPLLFGGLAAGLVAGSASCTAAQGGLLVALTGPEATRPEGAGRTEHAGGRTAGRPPAAGPRLVAAFGAGRLVTHVLAGALLGLLGGAVRLGPTPRAVLLVAAGLFVVVLAVRLIRRSGAGQRPAAACDGPGCPPPPPGTAADTATHPMAGTTTDTAAHPAANTAARPVADTAAHPAADAVADTTAHSVADTATHPAADAVADTVAHTAAGRGPGAGRALALGAATVLVPCGVTLGVEATAAATGSAVGGALLMAGFVAGSTPAFAVLGLLLRRVAATRFAALAGVVAIAAGLWTAVSGLRLAGWLPEPGTPPASAAAATMRPDGVQTITIWATAGGYRPAVVTLRADTPAELVFRVTDDATCTRTLTIEGRDTALPATVRLPPRPQGRLSYVCGMGMYPGHLHFR